MDRCLRTRQSHSVPCQPKCPGVFDMVVCVGDSDCEPILRLGAEITPRILRGGEKVFQLAATKNNLGEVNLSKAHQSVTHTWPALVHPDQSGSCWSRYRQQQGQCAKFPCPFWSDNTRAQARTSSLQHEKHRCSRYGSQGVSGPTQGRSPTEDSPYYVLSL